jgi:hypothetical protein
VAGERAAVRGGDGAVIAPIAPIALVALFIAGMAALAVWRSRNQAPEPVWRAAAAKFEDLGAVTGVTRALFQFGGRNGRTSYRVTITTRYGQTVTQNIEADADGTIHQVF